MGYDLTGQFRAIRFGRQFVTFAIGAKAVKLDLEVYVLGLGGADEDADQGGAINSTRPQHPKRILA